MSDENRNIRFKRLYDSYYQKTYFFFLRNGYTRQGAEDLAQETFIRVFKSMNSLREADLAEAWVKKIAKHILLNDVRAKHAEFRGGGAKEDSLDELVDRGQQHSSTLKQAPWSPVFRDPHNETERNQQKQFVEAALQELPAEIQNIYALKMQGFKDREIASLLGISHEVVRTRLTSLRKRLRASLGEELPAHKQSGGDPVE